MALVLTINGVERSIWKNEWRISKKGSQERMSFSIIDPVESAAAYRPEEGQTVLFHVGTALLFGGRIFSVDDGRAEEAGVVTSCECTDWMFYADEIFLPQGTYTSQTILELWDHFVTTYLAPKGVTNLVAASGGPVLPDMTIDNDTTTLRTAMDRAMEWARWPWRINGEKKGAVVEPGSLVWNELNGGNSALREDVRWRKELITFGTRLWAQTIAPEEAGAGPFMHEETHLADGVKNYFPVNLLPTPIAGSLNADATLAATSVAVKGLPINAPVRVGARFEIEGHQTLYEVTATTTTDGNGEIASLPFTPGLERDTDDVTSITFRRSAFIQLLIDGVDEPLAGSPWVWDTDFHALVHPGSSAAAATLTYRTWYSHPATIRAWDPATQNATGVFDLAEVIDIKVEEEEHADPVTGIAYLTAALARRQENPKVAKITTRDIGYYPYITCPLNFPDRLLSGTFVVEESVIRPTGAPPDYPDEYQTWNDLTLREGTEVGRTGLEYHRREAVG